MEKICHFLHRKQNYYFFIMSQICTENLCNVCFCSYLFVMLKCYFVPSGGFVVVFLLSNQPYVLTGPRGFAKSNTCYLSSCLCRREWSFSMEQMEVKAGNSHLNEKQPMNCSTSSKEVKPAEKVVTTSVFVNHGKSCA